MKLLKIENYNLIEKLNNNNLEKKKDLLIANLENEIKILNESNIK